MRGWVATGRRRLVRGRAAGPAAGRQVEVYLHSLRRFGRRGAFQDYSTSGEIARRLPPLNCCGRAKRTAHAAITRSCVQSRRGFDSIHLPVLHVRLSASHSASVRRVVDRQGTPRSVSRACHTGELFATRPNLLTPRMRTRTCPGILAGVNITQTPSSWHSSFRACPFRRPDELEFRRKLLSGLPRNAVLDRGPRHRLGSPRARRLRAWHD